MDIRWISLQHYQLDEVKETAQLNRYTNNELPNDRNNDIGGGPSHCRMNGVGGGDGGNDGGEIPE